MKSFIADKNRKLSKLALENIEDISYSALCRALRKKDVKVNGKRVSEDVLLSEGDVVEIYYQPVFKDKYRQIYIDDNVLIIYKESGYTSEDVFLTISKKYPGARFIHRLDRNTDGIMAFAMNAESEKELLFGFKERTFQKIYRATVKGVPKIKQAVLSAYLLKDSDSSIVKIYDNHVKGSAPIKTGYKLIKTDGETSVLEIELFTGKTHQIRAHLAYIGYPIVGDGKYGDFAFNKKYGVNSQMLTATSITFRFEKESVLSYLDGKTFNI